MTFSFSPKGGARAALLAAALLLPAALPASAAPADSSYVWRSVKIGGGGYIPGIFFSPLEKGLAYIRTDMGGIYRWQDDKKVWLPLSDDQTKPNYQGIESIAIDPVEPGVVYAAVGTYAKDPAAIFRSADHGDHWQVFPVSFRMGGNEEGRDLGERLAIDPNHTSTLYFGSRHDGLQISTDKGATWKQVESFPWKGLGAPADWHSHGGVSFVLFAPQADKGAKRGVATRTLFAAVADPAAHHLYRSTDSGKSWSPVPGEPDASLLPGQGQLVGNTLYITYADAKGPYGASHGGVYALDIKTGKWSSITPSEYPHSAYMGLTVDRAHPGTLAIATLDNDAEGGDAIFYSKDNGGHWTNLRPVSKRDVSEVPWLEWGRGSTNFGWWITGLAIDPFDAGHIAYTTGATIYATQDLGKPALQWKPWVEGIEQTAVLTLVSPPRGAPLISGFGDIGGFTHFDLTKSIHMQINPLFTNTNNIDYAGIAPNVIVRSGTHEPHATVKTATLGLSVDEGKSWLPLYAPLPAGFTETPPEKLGYNQSDAYIDAHIVVTADGKTVLVMTPEAVLSRDQGKSWNKVQGLPQDAWIVTDKADASRAYAMDVKAGVLFASHDGGAHFTPVKAEGLPAGALVMKKRDRETPAPLVAKPGKAGELWLASAGVLYRTTDGGAHFSRIESDVKISLIDFGKAAPGAADMAIYALGQKDDVVAVWRSSDNGRNWTRINGAAHEYCRMFRTLAADKNVYGRVYIGIDGRGILYGEPK